MIGDSMESGVKPKHLAKGEFAKRLYREMLKRGWNQSETGRQAGLPRDAISVYVRGKSLPEPANLEKLAKAFDMPAEQLLPNYLESAIDEDAPSFEMRVSVNAPNTAWVRVNRLVSLQTAVKIAELLEADNVLDRSGSGGSAAMQQDKA